MCYNFIQSAVVQQKTINCSRVAVLTKGSVVISQHTHLAYVFITKLHLTIKLVSWDSLGKLLSNWGLCLNCICGGWVCFEMGLLVCSTCCRFTCSLLRYSLGSLGARPSRSQLTSVFISPTQIDAPWSTCLQNCRLLQPARNCTPCAARCPQPIHRAMTCHKLWESRCSSINGRCVSTECVHREQDVVHPPCRLQTGGSKCVGKVLELSH